MSKEPLEHEQILRQELAGYLAPIVRSLNPTTRTRKVKVYSKDTGEVVNETDLGSVVHQIAIRASLEFDTYAAEQVRIKEASQTRCQICSIATSLGARMCNRHRYVIVDACACGGVKASGSKNCIACRRLVKHSRTCTFCKKDVSLKTAFLSRKHGRSAVCRRCTNKLRKERMNPVRSVLPGSYIAKQRSVDDFDNGRPLPFSVYVRHGQWIVSYKDARALGKKWREHRIAKSLASTKEQAQKYATQFVSQVKVNQTESLSCQPSFAAALEALNSVMVQQTDDAHQAKTRAVARIK
jgi:hypothetical protein